VRKLDTVIHKNESHGLKIQRDLVVFILYDSIYNQYKIVKIYNCKYHELSVLGTILSSFIYRLHIDNDTQMKTKLFPTLIIYDICNYTLFYNFILVIDTIV